MIVHKEGETFLETFLRNIPCLRFIRCFFHYFSVLPESVAQMQKQLSAGILPLDRNYIDKGDKSSRKPFSVTDLMYCASCSDICGSVSARKRDISHRVYIRGVQMGDVFDMLVLKGDRGSAS